MLQGHKYDSCTFSDVQFVARAKKYWEKCMLSHIQAHDRIDCDLVTHFPHATPFPPNPLSLPKSVPLATRRWGPVSLLRDHIQSVWVVCFPSETVTVLQCATFRAFGVNRPLSFVWGLFRGGRNTADSAEQTHVQIRLPVCTSSV